MKNSLLIFLIAIVISVSSFAFDSEPHVLVLPGHTNSLSAGPNGEALVTCDYKTLDGRVPRPGEPCTGEPTLAISVEDLRNLRYISQARDNNELVRRVYEKYDDIVFIVSPDFEIRMRPEYYEDVSPVTVRHPSVPENIYAAYARTARAVLRSRGPYEGEYMMGVTYSPFDYHPAFDEVGYINPTQNKWRPLAEYTLVFLPSNTSRSVVLHEFMHFLIEESREKSVVEMDRLIQIRKNRGLGAYLRANVLVQNSPINSEERRAGYELSNVITMLEEVDTAGEEIEIAYFVLKFHESLAMNVSEDDHSYSFWHFSDYFSNNWMNLLNILIDGSYFLPYYTQSYIRENLPLKIGNQVYPNYFKNVWNNIRTLARAYPQNLLGNENNPQPGTMMYQFIKDIGTREETMR